MPIHPQVRHSKSILPVHRAQTVRYRGESSELSENTSERNWADSENPDILRWAGHKSLDEVCNSLTGAAIELDQIVPCIQKLEKSIETYKKLMTCKKELDIIRSRFEENDRCLENGKIHLQPQHSGVSRSIEHFVKTASELHQYLQLLLDIKISKGTDASRETDEVDRRLNSLKLLIRRLKGWESNDVELEHAASATLTAKLSVMRYIQQLGRYAGEDIKALSESLVRLTKIEYQSVLHRQERERDILAGVATIISAATAAIIPEELKSNSEQRTSLEKAANTMWFLSLGFSLITAVNALLYQSRRSYMIDFGLYLKLLDITPRMFLSLSIVTFQVGLCLLSYASQQSLITSISITSLIGLNALSLLYASPLSVLVKRLYHRQSPEGISTDNTDDTLDVRPARVTWDPIRYIPIRGAVETNQFKPDSYSNLKREVFLDVIRQKWAKGRTAVEQSDISISGDGRYIAIVYNSGDCDIYHATIPREDIPPPSLSTPQVEAMGHTLKKFTSFTGFEYTRFTWFLDSKYALLTEKCAINKYRYIFLNMESKHRTVGPLAEHACYAMLHNTNAFIAVELAGKGGARFTLHSIIENSAGNYDSRIINTSSLTILKLQTSPRHITSMALTKDDKHLIYVEDSLLADPPEAWISVINLEEKTHQFKIPILHHVDQLCVALQHDDVDVVLVQLSNFIPILWELNFGEEKQKYGKVDSFKEPQAYASPKIKDMKGASIFCGVGDRWVVHWSEDGEVSWWDRRKGTLVRGPMEFQGVKCLSTCVVKAESDEERPVVKLAISYEDGRIELWAGKEAVVENLYDLTAPKGTGNETQGVR